MYDSWTRVEVLLDLALFFQQEHKRFNKSQGGFSRLSETLQHVSLFLLFRMSFLCQMHALRGKVGKNVLGGQVAGICTERAWIIMGRKSCHLLSGCILGTMAHHLRSVGIVQGTDRVDRAKFRRKLGLMGENRRHQMRFAMYPRRQISSAADHCVVVSALHEDP